MHFMLILSYHDYVITVPSFATSNKLGKIREESVKDVNSLQVKKERTFHAHLLVDSLCIQIKN